MRIGVFSARVNDGTVDDMVEEARRAEVDGFDTYWSSHIFSHDSLTALAIIGREVSRIELGTAVIPTYPRHPIAMAQQAMTVNTIAGGRLCLGIGLSHQVVIESMMGMSFEKPVRHLREYLSVLVPLSKGEPVSYEGEVYRVHAGLAAAGATPYPILVAALGPQLLHVAGTMTDGTITWCTGPQTLADHIIPTISSAAEEAGRPVPRIVSALPVCVTTDKERAYERAAKVFAVYGQLPSYRAMLDREGAAGPADLVIAGSADEVTERIRQVAEIGVSDFVGVEYSSDPDEAQATRAVLIASLAGRN